MRGDSSGRAKEMLCPDIHTSFPARFHMDLLAPSIAIPQGVLDLFIHFNLRGGQCSVRRGPQTSLYVRWTSDVPELIHRRFMNVTLSGVSDGLEKSNEAFLSLLNGTESK